MAAFHKWRKDRFCFIANPNLNFYRSRKPAAVNAFSQIHQIAAAEGDHYYFRGNCGKVQPESSKESAAGSGIAQRTGFAGKTHGRSGFQTETDRRADVLFAESAGAPGCKSEFQRRR